MEHSTCPRQTNGLNVNLRYTLSAVAVLLAFAGTARAQATPEFISMMGVVRDFQSAHPDFATMPSLGYGHYAGNVSLNLNASGKPSFTGSGHLVSTEWRDTAGRAIAPHMYNMANLDYLVWQNASLAVGSTIIVDNTGMIDSWDSTSGSYADTVGDGALIATNGSGSDVLIGSNATVGGTILVGADADSGDIVFESGATLVGMSGSLPESGTMPTIDEPTGMGPSTGNYIVAGTVTLSSDLHCDNAFLWNNSVLLIDGDVTMLVEGTLTMRQNSQIQILPGGSLKIYTKGAINALFQNAQINSNTQDPRLVTIYHMSTDPITFLNNSQIFATIYAPLATMTVRNDADFYGTYIGDSIVVENNAGLHLDTPLANLITTCGKLVADTAGARSGVSTGGITSTDTFNQWFTDTPGVNLSKRHAITLTLAADDNYELLTDAFHPIDGRLYGDEGSNHNRYFTYEIEGMFTYEGCVDQIFEFECDDDAWVFINDMLVIDLGGMRAGVPQTIELDRLGLSDGQEYSFKLFYAQRQGTEASFRMRTNVRVMTDPEVIALNSPVLYD